MPAWEYTLLAGERRHADGTEICPAIGHPRTGTVPLTRPLGERAVLDVLRGMPVTVTTTD